MPKTCTVVHCVTGIILSAFSGTAVAAADPPGGASQDRAAALHAFRERAVAYAALRDRLEEPLPPLQPTTDMAALLERRAQLASAITAARPEARQGDIFTLEAAWHLRRIVHDALEGIDADALVDELYAEHDVPGGFQPRVHDAYPDWAAHAMPAVLLASLPELPDDIEYRVIGCDLILLDVRADLMVDVLPAAIPATRPANRHSSTAAFGCTRQAFLLASVQP